VGVYVSVMLFEGFSLHLTATPDNVEGHPFHAANNVNGVGISSIVDYQVVPLDPRIELLQQSYVQKVVDTVHDLPNVLYEVANESSGQAARSVSMPDGTVIETPIGDTTQWQYRVIGTCSPSRRHRPRMPCVPPRWQCGTDTRTVRRSGRHTSTWDLRVAPAGRRHGLLCRAGAMSMATGTIPPARQLRVNLGAWFSRSVQGEGCRISAARTGAVQRWHDRFSWSCGPWRFCSRGGSSAWSAVDGGSRSQGCGDCCATPVASGSDSLVT
jgi:hypothetical protein